MALQNLLSLVNGAFKLQLKAPTLAADKLFTLPSGYGTSGQYLQTDGAGVLSFSTPTPNFIIRGVRVASVATVTVASAPSSIDGVTLASGDRILLKNQTTGSENGIYDFSAAASPLTRSSDSNTSALMLTGLLVDVAEGTVNSDTIWMLTTNNPIVLATTSLTFTSFPNLSTYASKYTNSFTNATLSSGILTVTHNLNNSAPVAKFYNNSGVEIVPDVTTSSANAFTADFTNFGTLSGTYVYTILG